MNGVFSMQNYTLMPLFQDIKRSTNYFSHLSFNHVYRDQNQEANQLSKVGVALDRGSWKIIEKA
jgi:hypothetical protein